MRLIDADALRREIKVDKYGHIDTTITALNIALERSRVNAEPVRHGRWKREFWFITCSVCDYCSADTDDEGDEIATNYCPNCGAKMDLEEVDDDKG